MSLYLAPDVEDLIRSKVSGLYTTPDDVVREAIRLLDERDRRDRAKFEALKRDLLAANDQLERGEVIDGEVAFDAVLQRLKAGR